jgi:hypothetical protein
MCSPLITLDMAKHVQVKPQPRTYLKENILHQSKMFKETISVYSVSQNP